MTQEDRTDMALTINGEEWLFANVEGETWTLKRDANKNPYILSLETGAINVGVLREPE
jgi:hypothetical protein